MTQVLELPTACVECGHMHHSGSDYVPCGTLSNDADCACSHAQGTRTISGGLTFTTAIWPQDVLRMRKAIDRLEVGRRKELTRVELLRAIEEAKEAQAEGRPVYVSWEDFLDRTTPATRNCWCRLKAKNANRPRLLSGAPMSKISWEDVWTILEAAQGRCIHCSSLALELRPTGLRGAPAPWEHIGRRIGSLDHIDNRFHGGPNTAENLAWACLWCNTWKNERHLGAIDHGGLPNA